MDAIWRYPEPAERSDRTPTASPHSRVDRRQPGRGGRPRGDGGPDDPAARLGARERARICEPFGLAMALRSLLRSRAGRLGADRVHRGSAWPAPVRNGGPPCAEPQGGGANLAEDASAADPKHRRRKMWKTPGDLHPWRADLRPSRPIERRLLEAGLPADVALGSSDPRAPALRPSDRPRRDDPRCLGRDRSKRWPPRSRPAGDREPVRAPRPAAVR